MYVRRFLLSTVVFVGILAISYSSAFAQGSPLFAVLNGGNEVNPLTGVARAGDPDGFGSATVTFSNFTPTSATLCYAILVSNITAATAAHIHRGPSGINGGIVVGLTAPVGSPGRVAGCVSIPLALYGELRAFPAQFYVNVHNAAFPNGAVRGQLF
jgi:CHRD domain